MSPYLQELDYQMTPLGPISLRRRRQLKLDVDVVEVILGEEHLMSDLFTVSEKALSKLALTELSGEAHNILIGGLGLGYTAATALDNSTVTSATIIEYLSPVIRWHQEGILPLGRQIIEDPRCRLIEADFFRLAAVDLGLVSCGGGELYDCVLLDIDHSPNFFLNPSHGAFYTAEGLEKFSENLCLGGVFALWSNDAPDPVFVSRLQGVFERAWAADIIFNNPLLEEECCQTIYLAIR